MGTNFYLRTNVCPTCGRFDRVHIGKASAGWTFSFQATDKIRSAADWRAEMKKGEVFDEYGSEWSFDRFWAMVEERRNAPRNHGKEAIIDLGDQSFLDPEGNSMTPVEFA